MPPVVSLGIDISKASFHAAVLKSEPRAKVKAFTNDEAGLEALSGWLGQQGLEPVHGCLEATSLYRHGLATDLHGQGHVVSLVNPARINRVWPKPTATHQERPCRGQTDGPILPRP